MTSKSFIEKLLKLTSTNFMGKIIQNDFAAKVIKNIKMISKILIAQNDFKNSAKIVKNGFNKRHS